MSIRAVPQCWTATEDRPAAASPLAAISIALPCSRQRASGRRSPRHSSTTATYSTAPIAAGASRQVCVVVGGVGCHPARRMATPLTLARMQNSHSNGGGTFLIFVADPKPYGCLQSPAGWSAYLVALWPAATARRTFGTNISRPALGVGGALNYSISCYS